MPGPDAKPAGIGDAESAGRRRVLLDRGMRLACIAAAAATALSFLGGQSWFFELFTHFRLQLAGGSFLLLAIAGLRRRGRLAAVAGVTAAVNLALLLPYVWPQPQSAQAAPNVIRILVANVSKTNDDYPALRELVAAEAPDVVGLLEADQGWVDGLSGMASRFPYRVLRPQDGAYGIALYSRERMQELRGSPHRRDGLQTAVSVDLSLGGVPATLLLAHVMAPLGPSFARLRNEQLADLVGILDENPGKLRVLVGDLNITPWSPEYPVLERQTGLVNAALGRGYLGSWPVSPALLRIPIDHCLVSEGIRVADVRLGPDIGSDHLPLIVDLVVSSSSRVNSGG